MKYFRVRHDLVLQQNGGGLTDPDSTMRPPTNHTGNTDAEQSQSRRAENPSVTKQPPTSATSNIREARASDATETRPVNIDEVIRNGGILNGFHILPRPRFNSVDLHRTMNMRDIMSPDLATYHDSLHCAMDEIVSFARQIGGDAPVINLVMTAPSLNSSINAVLSQVNDYDVNLFTDQIEKILQSNDRLMADDAVDIGVTVVMNRRGG